MEAEAGDNSAGKPDKKQPGQQLQEEFKHHNPDAHGSAISLAEQPGEDGWDTERAQGSSRTPGLSLGLTLREREKAGDVLWGICKGGWGSPHGHPWILIAERYESSRSQRSSEWAVIPPSPHVPQTPKPASKVLEEEKRTWR